MVQKLVSRHFILKYDFGNNKLNINITYKVLHQMNQIRMKKAPKEVGSNFRLTFVPLVSRDTYKLGVMK
jgi:hypothetical protein